MCGSPTYNLPLFAWSAENVSCSRLGVPMPSHHLSECSQRFQWYYKSISASQMLETHLWTNYRTGATADVSHFVLFCIFSRAFFPFVDYGKYNICFQNVGLAGIRKESAWQADYLGLLHYGDADSLRYGAGFDHSQVVLSFPGFNTEINKRALVCEGIFNFLVLQSAHPYEGPMGRRGPRKLYGGKKKSFNVSLNLFLKFLSFVSGLLKIKLTMELGESKISMIPLETTHCPFVEPNSKHSRTPGVCPEQSGTLQPYLLMQHQTTSWVFCLLVQVTNQSEPGETDNSPLTLISTPLLLFRPCLKWVRQWAAKAELRMPFRGNYVKLCSNIRKCGIFTR